MKLIIDIDDKDYEKLKDGHIPFSILDVMQNGTPIPDNATNRDVIEIMFSNGFSAKKIWWDAPYQKGGKE